MKAAVGDGKKNIVLVCVVNAAHVDDAVGGKLVVHQGHLIRGGNVVAVRGQKKDGLAHHLRRQGVDPLALVLVVAIDDDGVVNLLAVQHRGEDHRRLAAFAAGHQLVKQGVSSCMKANPNLFGWFNAGKGFQQLRFFFQQAALCGSVRVRMGRVLGDQHRKTL